MEGILGIHQKSGIKNDQYNLKYTTASQISASQPNLNSDEKLQLSVRTKGTEIIERLPCVLWVYCKGI